MKWQGKGVSEGLAMAQIHLFTPKLPEISRQPAADAEAEVAKLEATLAAAEEELRGLYETAKEKMGEQEAEIFDAHLTILGDEYSVREPIIQRIREQKQNAAAAITDQFDELAQMFRSLGDELMAERAADAEDLKQQLLRICLGCGRQDLSVLPGDVIVLAEELTPSDTVRMDTAHVKGIATRLGGATAHSAIIARTLGIPAAAGIDGWQTEALNGHMAILDGADGTLTVDPTDEETASYQSRKAQADCEAQALEAFRTCPSQTKDGAALDSLSGEYDIHGDNGAHCYIGYRHSLCHGWSSAPAAFLAERVLGIRLLEPGCRRIGIYPELGGLEWAEGEYPTPYGTVSVKCRKTGDGKISVEYKAPEQIEIEIGSGVSM